jgi:hypothetical protein
MPALATRPDFCHLLSIASPEAFFQSRLLPPIRNLGLTRLVAMTAILRMTFRACINLSIMLPCTNISYSYRDSPQDEAQYYLAKVQAEAALFDKYMSGSISSFFYGIWHKWVAVRTSPEDLTVLQEVIVDASARLVRGHGYMSGYQERISRYTGPDIPEWREADKQIRRVEQAIRFAGEVQEAMRVCLESNPSRINLLFELSHFGFQRWNEID